MKKFCSKCGALLDLSKKSCTACHAFNPFFISGFTNTSDTSAAPVVELRNEVIVASPPVIENTSLQEEHVEREKADQDIKEELLRVKEKNEQYKKETLDLVKGVQQELYHINQENKLLKQKVELLNQTKTEEEKEIVVAPIQHLEPQEKSSRGIVGIAAITLLLITTGVSYMVFNHGSKPPVEQTKKLPETTAPALAVQSTTKPTPVATNNNPQPAKLLAAATPAPAANKTTAPVTAPPVVPTAKPNSTPFSLSATRVMGDLVGKKLSGCDITINNASEIEHVDNLILVEKLSASYLKYKCTVKIKQGAEVFTSTPYMYYSAEGTFIKVDGTNCE